MQMQGWQIWSELVHFAAPVNRKEELVLLRDFNDKSNLHNFMVPAQLVEILNQVIQGSTGTAILNFISKQDSRQFVCKEPAVLNKLKELKVLSKNVSAIRLCNPILVVVALNRFGLQSIGVARIKQLAYVKKVQPAIAPGPSGIARLRAQAAGGAVELKPAQEVAFNVEDLYYPAHVPFPTNLAGNQPYDQLIPYA